jgi:hypothetical protein
MKRIQLQWKGAQASCLFLNDAQATDAKATGRMPMLLFNLFVGSDASTFNVFFLDEDQRIHWKDKMDSVLGDDRISGDCARRPSSGRPELRWSSNAYRVQTQGSPCGQPWAVVRDTVGVKRKTSEQ